MQRADLQSLSRTRLREAKTLFAADEFSGAYYLAGYAVECALKACIAKTTQRFEFPDRNRVQSSYSHNLRELVNVANLADQLRDALKNDPQLEVKWTIVTNWSEQARYMLWNRADADAMLKAVAARSGVLSWFMKRW